MFWGEFWLLKIPSSNEILLGVVHCIIELNLRTFDCSLPVEWYLLPKSFKLFVLLIQSVIYNYSSDSTFSLFGIGLFLLSDFLIWSVEITFNFLRFEV